MSFDKVLKKNFDLNMTWYHWRIKALDDLKLDFKEIGCVSSLLSTYLKLYLEISNIGTIFPPSYS